MFPVTCAWLRSRVACCGVGLLWNRVTMATSEERLEQLEQTLQQAGNALQAANYRIATLETAAGAPATPVTTTSSTSYGRHAIVREALYLCLRRSILEEVAAAVSPELRALKEKTRTAAEDVRNVSLALLETAVLHALSEHEWRGAGEVAECARG